MCRAKIDAAPRLPPNEPQPDHTMTLPVPLRAKHTDLQVLLCGLAATVVYLLYGFDGQLHRDQAMYVYAGQRVAAGAAPYIDMFERTGPLAQLIPGIGVLAARAANVDDIIGIRVLFTLLAAASVSLAYLLGRDFFHSRLAGLASAAALLCFEGFIYFASNGPSEKTAMVLFLLAALIAMNRRSWIVTGVFVSLATLTWQPVFLPAIAGTVTAVLSGVSRGHRLSAVGRIAVGGLIPTTLTIGAYIAIGRLGTLLDGFLLVNLRYTNPRSFLWNVDGNWRALLRWYGISLSVLLIGIIAVLATSAAMFVTARGRHRQAPAPALLGVGVLTLVGIAWTVWEFDNAPDVFFLLPSGALGIGALISAVEAAVRRDAAVAVTVAAALAMTTIALTFSIGVRPAGLGRAVRPEGLQIQREAVSAVLEAIPGDEVIFSVEAPQPLALSQKRNGSQFQLYGSGLVDYVEDTWPGGIQGYIEWIEEHNPTIVAVGRDRVPPWLAPTLDERYQRVGSAPGWTWYIRKDLGRDGIRPIREAIHQWQQQFMTESGATSPGVKTYA